MKRLATLSRAPGAILCILLLAGMHAGAVKAQPVLGPPVWQISAGDVTWLANDHATRGTAFNPVTGNVYAVSRTGGLNIRVIDGTTGDVTGTLSTEGISGGVFPLNLIGVSQDGNIFAVNLVTDASASALKIYWWENEVADPVAVFDETADETNNLGAKRYGDALGVEGGGGDDLFVYVSGSGNDQIAKFQFNGAMLGTPTILSIPAGIARLGISPVPGEDFLWVNGAGTPTTKINSMTGAVVTEISGAVVGTGNSSVKYLEFNGGKFLVVGPLGTAAEGQHFTLVDVTDEDNIQVLGMTDPLGPNSNPNATGAINYDPANQRLFVLGTNNALAAFDLDHEEPETYEANLAGYNEPAPNPFGPPEEGFFPLTVVTPASGWFEVELDGNDFIMSGEFSGLKADFTGSHIHIGVAGVNGPVVVPLTPTLDPDMRGGTFDQTETVSGELVAALRAGELYFNVHSTAHPPGEIRGQLLLKPNSPPEQADPQLAPGFSFDFVNEGPPDEPAFVLEWDAVTDPDGDRVIYQLEAAIDPDFDSVVIGALSVLNGVVFTEIGASRGMIDDALETLGVPVGDTFTFFGRVNSSDGSLRTIGETMMFNIERGVVEEPEPVVFEANLAGHNEVLSNPFGTQEEGFYPFTAITPASGWFEAELDGDQLHMTGAFSDLVGDYTASHIHTGVAGVAGPVVIPLDPTLDGDMRGGTFDETATLSQELIDALHAGELYVNVHSQVYPPGEVRGQLLLKPNSPPEQTDVTSVFDLTWVNEGDPNEPAYRLEWDPVTDPDGNRVIYQAEYALDPDFTMVIASLLTVLEGEVFHFDELSKGLFDVILEQLGVGLGESITVYGRINSSDGSLRTLGETLVANVTRGIIEEPVDEEPPSCRIVQVNPGPPAFVEVEVQDEQSGIASIEVLRDVNLTVEVPEFEPGTTDALIVRGTKIDNDARASLIIRVTDVAGNETTCDPVIATLVAEVPQQFELGQNYPNPFNPSTSFDLLLPESSHVTLTVYDVTGRLVTTLLDQHMEAGTYRIEWDGTGDSGILPSGVYLYHVSAAEYQAVRKMTLIR